VSGVAWASVGEPSANAPEASDPASTTPARQDRSRVAVIDLFLACLAIQIGAPVHPGRPWLVPNAIYVETTGPLAIKIVQTMKIVFCAINR
jgi:hypothetical protein